MGNGQREFTDKVNGEQIEVVVVDVKVLTKREDDKGVWNCRRQRATKW